MEKTKKRVAAHQPNFLPWVGFWHKYLSSDTFIICSGTQTSKKSFSNRVMMADNNTWATVPIMREGILQNDVKIADPTALPQLGRRIRHWSKQSKYKYGHRLEPIIDRLTLNKSLLLSDLNIDLISVVAHLIDQNGSKIVVDNSSWSGVATARKIEQIITGYGDCYLAGPSTPNYLSRSDLSHIPEVFLQKINENVPTTSILHVIALERDPADFIMAQGSWQKWPVK